MARVCREKVRRPHLRLAAQKCSLAVGKDGGGTGRGVTARRLRKQSQNGCHGFSSNKEPFIGLPAVCESHRTSSRSAGLTMSCAGTLRCRRGRQDAPARPL